MTSSDRRIDQARQIDDAVALDRLGYDDPTGEGPIVAVVISGGAPGKYCTVQAVGVGGAETEGSDAELTPTGPNFLAANVGTGSAPAKGYVILHPVPSGRWAFRY